MKPVDVRFFAAAVFAPLLLGLPLASANPPAPTPAPPVLPRFASLPSARGSLSPSGIGVRAIYNNPNQPMIQVTFVASRVVPNAKVVEYHVFRNQTLVARFTRTDALLRGNLMTFQDIGSPLRLTPVTNNSVNYVTANIGDPSQLSDARSIGIRLFPAGEAIVYRVTVLQAAEGAGGRPVYVETEVGKSNPITPFQ